MEQHRALGPRLPVVQHLATGQRPPVERRPGLEHHRHWHRYRYRHRQSSHESALTAPVVGVDGQLDSHKCFKLDSGFAHPGCNF